MTSRSAPVNRATPRSAPPPARSWRESVEWGRKAIHVCSTLLAVWVLLVDDPRATLGLALATVFVIAVDLSRLRAKRWALWIYRTFPLIFRRDDKTILGVHMIGVAASELIHVGMMVVHLGGTIDDLLSGVFNYPTMSEVYRIAALDGLNRL